MSSNLRALTLNGLQSAAISLNNGGKITMFHGYGCSKTQNSSTIWVTREDSVEQDCFFVSCPLIYVSYPKPTLSLWQERARAPKLRAYKYYDELIVTRYRSVGTFSTVEEECGSLCTDAGRLLIEGDYCHLTGDSQSFDL